MSLSKAPAHLFAALLMISITAIGCVPAPVETGSDGAADAPDTAAASDSDDLSDAPPQSSDEALPDFSALDANAQSPRSGEAVSPRDYLGGISAWYFGHST